MAMAAVESTHDIRAHGTERKRVVDSQTKWNPKWSAGDDRHIKYGPNDTKRPVTHPWPKRYTPLRRKMNARDVHATNVNRKVDPLGSDDAYSVAVSEAELSAALDDGYDEAPRSFDHSTSPSEGAHVLTHAVTQAVQRFEDRQTTKLVKDEYEVVDSSDERDDSGGGGGSSTSTRDDDDFELL